jgi:lipopolysaccharide export system permease protein
MFVAIFVFLVGFLLSFQLVKITGLIFSPDISLFETLDLVGKLCLTFIPIAAPISLFLGIIFFFNRMSNDSEFVAIKSFGVSNTKILIPVLLVSAPLAVNSYFMGQNIIPQSKREFRVKLAQLRSKSLFNELRSGKFFYSIPGVVLYTGDYDKEKLSLKNVYIFLKSVDKKLRKNEKIIFAKSGLFQYKYKDGQDFWELFLELNEGNIVMLNDSGKEIEKVLFQKYRFPLLENNFKETLQNKASLMSGSQLRKFLNLTEEEKKERQVSAKDLNKAEVELANRTSLPVMILLFSILGFCVGVGHSRIRNKRIGGQTFVILMVYYSLYFAGIGVAKKGKVSADLAISVSLAFLGAYSFYKFRKINWID